jgi:hypothetical protein
VVLVESVNRDAKELAAFRGLNKGERSGLGGSFTGGIQGLTINLPTDNLERLSQTE